MLKRVRIMACKITYFRPHGQRHGRASQPCVTHGRVTRPCVLCSFQRVASQVLHDLAHSLAHEHVRLFEWYTAWHMSVWFDHVTQVDELHGHEHGVGHGRVSLFRMPTRPKTRVCLLAV